jgi:lysophospholipase L1-like esterase
VVQASRARYGPELDSELGIQSFKPAGPGKDVAKLGGDAHLFIPAAQARGQEMNGCSAPLNALSYWAIIGGRFTPMPILLHLRLAILLAAATLLGLVLCACRAGSGSEAAEMIPAESAALSAPPTAIGTPPVIEQAATAAPQAEGAADIVRPDDPRLRYTGRFDFSDPQRPRFDWPAVTIEAAFSGPSAAVLLEDGRNSYDVTVNGQTTVLRTRPGQTRYPLAQGLGAGPHQLRLTKRTETFYGTPRFLGLELAPGFDLADLPADNGRHIEFIGDSITAGYGVEGASPTCNYSPETENAARTYAAQTAAQLDAAYSITAVSGVGVVRNYNDDGPLSAGTMLTYYGRTLANEPAEDWQAAQPPQAVVINLGTNDFSTTPHPAGEVFLQGYTNLIIKVRQRYPNAHIFAVGGPIMAGPAVDTIRSVVAQMNEMLGDERVHFVPIENTLEQSAVDYGCDWHPNESGQRKIAAQLAPVIAAVLGW